MEFRIADTFTDSLASLTGEDTRDGEGGRCSGLRANGTCRGAETGRREEAHFRWGVR
jgi:hypothetical protein